VLFCGILKCWIFGVVEQQLQMIAEDIFYLGFSSFFFLLPFRIIGILLDLGLLF
jgi:hypothetical protein